MCAPADTPTPSSSFASRTRIISEEVAQLCPKHGARRRRLWSERGRHRYSETYRVEGRLNAEAQARTQDADGGASLEKVRDPLFGVQMRDYDRKFRAVGRTALEGNRRSPRVLRLGITRLLGPWSAFPPSTTRVISAKPTRSAIATVAMASPRHRTAERLEFAELSTSARTPCRGVTRCRECRRCRAGQLEKCTSRCR